MGRHKTISDDDVLAIARGVFRQQGHAASTREIARAAGVSEAVLYQRFGNKDALFFLSMAPRAPDLAALLGPEDPPGDAHTYLREVVERMATYFSEVLPIGIQVMIHPSFDMASFSKSPAANVAGNLQAGLLARLEVLQRRKAISVGSPASAARLLTSLAHDWALHSVFSGALPPRRDLFAMIDTVWHGFAPAAAGAVTSRRGPTSPTPELRRPRRTAG
jgi:AcrR family transcriptional regulator